MVFATGRRAGQDLLAETGYASGDYVGPFIKKLAADKSFSDTSFTVQFTVGNDGFLRLPEPLASDAGVALVSSVEADANETLTFRLADFPSASVESSMGASFETISTPVVEVDVTTASNWVASANAWRPQVEAKVSGGSGALHGTTVQVYIPL